MINLFEKDSVLDLALRGFDRNYILNQTNCDVGYHNSKIKSKMKNIDRIDYCTSYILTNFDEKYILSVLSQYSSGMSKHDVLKSFDLCGDNTIKLYTLFEKLGFLHEFQSADKFFRKMNMKNGIQNKYGVDNVFSLSSVQEAAKKTRIEKYGAAYTFCNESSLCSTARHTLSMQDDAIKKDIVAKRKYTMCQRYGVESPIQSDTIKNKMETTMLNKYGQTHYAKTDDFKTKRRDYMLEHGKEIADKARWTCLSKYGKLYYMQTDKARKQQSMRMHEYGADIYSKMKATMLNKYGVAYYSQTSSFSDITHNRMCEHSAEYMKKARETCLERYGKPYYMQTNEARKRQSTKMLNPAYNKHIIDVKRKNGTLNTSKSEKLLYELLLSRFDKNDIFPQYKDVRYPFYCDFYIKSRDMFIELNGFWTHGDHWFSDENDSQLLEHWKSYNTSFYHVAIKNWSERDVKKRKYAADNNLNYIVFWGSSLDDAKLWFAMDCPDGQDWRQEYSWLPYQRLMLNNSFANLWNSNPYCNNKPGTIQSYIYSKVYKCFQKLPYDLSDNDIYYYLSYFL